MMNYWIFLKTKSKHRQVISNYFSKCFRGADDFVVFYESLNNVKGFSWLSKIYQVTITTETLQYSSWNYLTMFWLNLEKN